MSAHVPVFQVNKDRKGSKKFAKDAKADILATIEFLYKRGMWSKFHYDKWKAAAEEMNDEMKLHMWWDEIVNSTMFEMDLDEFFEFKEGLAGESCKGKKWKD